MAHTSRIDYDYRTEKTKRILKEFTEKMAPVYADYIMKPSPLMERLRRQAK